jgi:hypothetical protein
MNAMTTDVLQMRERAFEYEFFHKVDEELLSQLRENMKRANRRALLEDATGIKESRVLDELIESGIDGGTMMAFSLFPLVWIAWADGHIEADERAAILSAAESAGLAKDSASYRMMEWWTEHCPGTSLQQAWKDYVQYLAKTMSPTAFGEFKANVLQRAHELADSIYFRYGFHDAESSQDQILKQLDVMFKSPAA